MELSRKTISISRHSVIRFSGRKLIRGDLILQAEPAVLVLRSDEVLLVIISKSVTNTLRQRVSYISSDPTNSPFPMSI